MERNASRESSDRGRRRSKEDYSLRDLYQKALCIGAGVGRLLDDLIFLQGYPYCSDGKSDDDFVQN